MSKRSLLFIVPALVILLACTTVSAPIAPTQAAATEVLQVAASPTATQPVPDYAVGVRWIDINGDKHLFMVEEPAMEQYKVPFANWSIDITNTDQTITVLRYGEPRGSILVGVWTYIHENDQNLLIDIAIMGTNDSGEAIEGLTVAVLDQTAPNMQLSQLKFSKDLIGTTTNIVPVGLDCEVIPSDPDGHASETDGSSVFVAFICAPRYMPTS